MIQHPIRKTRSKTRKPKFLSLRLEISSFENPQMTQKQQLNLFPLHPENHVEDRDENMEFIFNNDVNNTCCCLQSFLPNDNNNNNNNNTISVSSEDDCGVGVGVDRCEEDADSLVRTAMRSRERSEVVEEKWVCYSEVVEKKGASESVEVSSSAAADEGLKKKQNRRQLSLKLDYQGILKAWSDKAPLYIKHEFPQTVPSLYDDHNLQSDSSFADRLMDGWGTDGNAWKVPEMGEKKEDLEAKEGCKMAQREASVLRYKEKRQSRLFSKRIRYEVRKLNAEKRPRMKGRFVKRN